MRWKTKPVKLTNKRRTNHDKRRNIRALWAFNATHNFRDALVAAVNLGGDADTIGAVCGQIAGAYYGYSAIPREWLEAVKD